MSIRDRTEYLSGASIEPLGEEELRFRLVYQGPLYAKQNDARNGQPVKKAEHVHEIRRSFHNQLKALWETNRFLNEHKSWRSDHGAPDPLPDGLTRWSKDEHEREPLVDIIADLYRENNYRFVPLVRKDWHLCCELDVLFLRQDPPGSIVHAGDIDNRLKTLIDALRKPESAAELAGNGTPKEDEDPFFVLLEDDKLVTALSVETDTLLDCVGEKKPNPHHVHLVVTATIKPIYTTMFNLSFA